ncbi:MAG: isocitrate/isopropylmalate family dehydrogenase, partial [Acidobacteriota bacterium]|nr:isocitrate/isopropylmalate family dehydrogenase [Acidobacteriota bacterium]
IANPTAIMLSAVLMLRHIDETDAADLMENAMMDVFKEGEIRTRDLGGTASTADFASAIIEKMG